VLEKSPNARAVIWDIDDTLVATSEMAMSAQMASLSVLIPEDSSLISRALRIWSRLLWYFYSDAIERTMEALLCELGMDPVSDQRLEKAASVFWETFNSEVLLIPNARSVLARLSSSGISLGIVSNGEEEFQFRKLEVGRILDFFPDELIIVAPPGTDYAKPSPFGILDCCRRMSLSPDNVWYVGNRTTDIIAANLAGVHSVRYQIDSLDVKEPCPYAELRLETSEVEICDLNELLDILT
jgi:phosphoglycolate phosphatase-like HAD superfamily hydrolase